MKIAVVNDYLRLAQSVSDWSRISATCEITVFDRSFADDNELVDTLKPFDIIVMIRERMPLSRKLIERLPNLKMIAITGLYNRTLDVAAAVERGIVVCYTE